MATTDDEQTLSPPERLLHEVRRESHYWLHQAIRAQAGLGEYREQEAAIELTTSLENYWRLLRTPTLDYLPSDPSHEDDLNRVAELWLEEPLFMTEQGQVCGLYALRDWWHSSRRIVEESDSVLGRSQTEVREVPVTLSVRQGRQVIQRLDELGAELDVGYQPDRQQIAEIDYSHLYPGEGPESLEHDIDPDDVTQTEADD